MTQTPFVPLLAKLSQILRPDQIISDPEMRACFSVDFSEEPGAVADVIVRPESSEDVALTVRAAADSDYAVLVRGGGMSYTRGYVPSGARSLILDMSGMNRIIEINCDNLYVIAEAGVTWLQMAEALKGTGYHIPFGGTLSGERATVGGGLASGATGVKKGEITDYILGMEVVLPDGRIVTTGSMATGAPMQPMRHYGPDLTGLFTHDAGSLGIKTRAVFRLHPAPGGIGYACIGFNDTAALIDAMCEIGRSGLGSEVVAFGEYHNRMFAMEPRPDFAQVREMLGTVYRAGPTRTAAIRNVMHLCRPNGLKFLKDWKHTLLIIADGDSPRVAGERIRKLKTMAVKRGGRNLPPALAIVMRSMPFQPVERLIVGWQAENNSFPSNRTVRYSDAHALSRLVQDFWSENRALMTRHGIVVTELYLIVNATFGIEPIIYWRDAVNPLRLSVIGEERRGAAASIPANEDARAAAIDLRHRLVERMGQLTGAHFQIGKFYPYQRDLVREENRQLLAQIKDLLDHKQVLNPGGLGIEHIKDKQPAL